MAVVRVHPPAVAESDEQVAEEPAEDVVAPAGGEDRLMPGVVAEERDLAERDVAPALSPRSFHSAYVPISRIPC